MAAAVDATVVVAVTVVDAMAVAVAGAVAVAVAVVGLSVRTAHPPPLTNISSGHPEEVRSWFLYEKLYLFKASFGLCFIKHLIHGILL